MNNQEKAFYKIDAVGHLISYSTDETNHVKDDARSRWAYLIVNKQEAKSLLKGDEKTSDDISKVLLDEYYSLIHDAIKEEEDKVEYNTLTNNTKYSNYKNIVLISSKNHITTKGKYSILQAKNYIFRSKKLQENYKQTISLLEISKQKAKEHLQEEIAKNNGFILVNRSKIAKSKEAEEPFALLSLPYVYNFEDNSNINSSLIATIKKEEAICSVINPYNIEGKWTNENKQEILEYDMFDKDKKVFFHIKTVDMPDGTIAKLTIMDEDIVLDDKITTLSFTINNNEAFIPIEFDKIKFNLLKALKYEDEITKYIDGTEILETNLKTSPKITSNLELYAIIEIKKFKIKKELAKDTYLKVSTQYVKIGTRSLKNLPYPDSMPPIPIPVVSTYVTATELTLDTANLAPIHQQIAFVSDENIGFTTAFEENNDDENGDSYGMLKDDPGMSDISDTKIALSKYAWDSYCCDEDTFKEAIYKVINEKKYAVSDTVADMNSMDLRKVKDMERKAGEKSKLTFTQIIRYTPQEGIRYSLLNNNCQDFVSKVQRKYKALSNEMSKKEKL